MADNGAHPHTWSSSIHFWWQLPHCAAMDMGGMVTHKSTSTGRGENLVGKTGPFKSPRKKRPSKTDANSSSNNTFPKTNIDSASQPSFLPTILKWLQIVKNLPYHQSSSLIPMPLLHPAPSSQKYPQQALLPCIHWIVSGMVIKMINTKMKLVRNKWDVWGAIILSIVMLVGW